MEIEKTQYDLICSLGGNCAAAHNLLIRDLRPASYPFDWTYFNSDEAVYVLVNGFKDGFKNYMLKDNLKELPVNPSHSDRIQYEDLFGKIVWANHFSYNEDRNENYNKVKATFDRRFSRLLDSIQASQKILFLFCTSFFIKPDSFLFLIDALKELYPGKLFQIKVVSFDCAKDSIHNNENLEIFYYNRKIHDYDFLKTSFEWSFLDTIKPFKMKRNKISFKFFGYRVKIERNKHI